MPQKGGMKDKRGIRPLSELCYHCALYILNQFFAYVMYNGISLTIKTLRQYIDFKHRLPCLRFIATLAMEYTPQDPYSVNLNLGFIQRPKRVLQSGTHQRLTSHNCRYIVRYRIHLNLLDVVKSSRICGDHLTNLLKQFMMILLALLGVFTAKIMLQY